MWRGSSSRISPQELRNPRPPGSTRSADRTARGPAPYGPHAGSPSGGVRPPRGRDLACAGDRRRRWVPGRSGAGTRRELDGRRSGGGRVRPRRALRPPRRRHARRGAAHPRSCGRTPRTSSTTCSWRRGRRPPTSTPAAAACGAGCSCACAAAASIGCGASPPRAAAGCIGDGENAPEDADAKVAPVWDGARPRARAEGARRACPRRSARCVELAYFEGMTCSEMAAHCAIPIGTVKSRLSAAMGKLREALAGGREVRVSARDPRGRPARRAGLGAEPVAPSPRAAGRGARHHRGAARSSRGFTERLATFFDLAQRARGRADPRGGRARRRAGRRARAAGRAPVPPAGGPRVAAADCGLVRLEPGVRFPRPPPRGRRVVVRARGRGRGGGDRRALDAGRPRAPAAGHRPRLPRGEPRAPSVRRGAARRPSARGTERAAAVSNAPARSRAR